MISINIFKNTFLFFVFFVILCGNAQKKKSRMDKDTIVTMRTVSGKNVILFGSENYEKYIPLLQDKKVGIVTNQTGIIYQKRNQSKSLDRKQASSTHLVDYLLNDEKINMMKIYSPEHGFRGVADAGEFVKDGRDPTTNLPIISLYGENKKPNSEQLKGIDIMVFDLQDVGVRFYSYISSLHYIMEACSENNISLIILDRPNPNINIVDGPILEMENKSFVGMHPTPTLHGMTIGEYGQMINGQKWLNNDITCKLTVIPCLNYTRETPYSLPVKPSPNLPNDQSINLYASLCLFEGTNVSVGRGTEKQFQIYGSPFLLKHNFSFTPKPNLGAKKPLYNGKLCYGEDLSAIKKVNQLEIKWLIKAYKETSDKTKFFNNFFLKLVGTKKLRQQIEQGLNETQIRTSWEKGLSEFKKMREPYLLYP